MISVFLSRFSEYFNFLNAIFLFLYFSIQNGKSSI